MAHLLAFRLVGLTIALQRSVPAQRNLCAGEKSELRRVPVTAHKTGQVVPVPGILLHVQHLLDSSFLSRFRRSTRSETGCEQDGNDPNREHLTRAHARTSLTQQCRMRKQGRRNAELAGLEPLSG